MKILMINPILYTSESSPVKKVSSIKDTMIYNLCIAFKNAGHDIVLIAAEDFKPTNIEDYDFEIKFLRTKFKKIFKPHCLPFLGGLGKYLKSNKFDLIITSEVFSINSLYLSIKYKKNTLVWHELAKHNNIMKKIPSKIWYNIIARLFFRKTRVVARSINSQEFIKRYCDNVSEKYIDHGVDLKKFIYSEQKDKYFVVLSQLINRKRIDGIINAFCKLNNKNYRLIIIGDGEEKEKLIELSKKNNMTDNIEFKGHLSHKDVIPILRFAMAMLVNTEKDNNMVSIVESIALCTPVVTTNVPYNSVYIKNNNLGIVVKDSIKSEDLQNVIIKNKDFVKNCKIYRNKISNKEKVKQFINEYNIMKNGIIL